MKSNIKTQVLKKTNSTQKVIKNFKVQETDIRDLREQDRLDRMHLVTHILAGVIIACFVIPLFYSLMWKTEVVKYPDYFISIVSMVTALYFSKSLFSK